MQRISRAVAEVARKSQGRVLVVGSASCAERPRSAFHAVMQASQSSGVPCVPFTPPVKTQENRGTASALIDHAIDGLDMARRTGCGSVVVVGGGCTIEIGKAIAALIPSSASSEFFSQGSRASGVDRGSLLIEAASAAGPIADVVAAPTTLHGCAAASSTRNWLVDPLEGDVIGLDEGYHFKDLPIQCIIEPNLLKESHPSVCAHGALSTLARLSDSLLAPPPLNAASENKSQNVDAALLDLLSQTHLVARKVLAIENSGATNMGAKVKVEVGDKTIEEEDAIEQCAAIGCIAGRCVSVDGPGLVHALARVVCASYNLTFGEACAILLPKVAAWQIERGLASESTIASMVRIFSMGSSLPNASSLTLPELLSDLTAKVRSDLNGTLPGLGDDDLNEISFSAFSDPSFKEAAKNDGGLKSWGSPQIKKVVKEAFGFLGGEK